MRRVASIRKRPRKDGTICYSVLYTLDGRQTSMPFDDHKAAEVFRDAVNVHGAARALEMHGLHRVHRHTSAEELTVAQWVKRYIDSLTGVEQYTLDVYERYLRRDIEPMLGAIPLARLSEEDIASWVKWLETTERPKTGRLPTPKTIANIHGFLSGALGKAAAKHLIAANPAAGRRLPRKTGDDNGHNDDAEDIQMLTRDEFAELVDAFTPHWRPLLRFLVVSGCRWGEATALKPSDVDRHAGTVKIRRAWKYSSAGYKIGPTKTKRSRRMINVSKKVLNELDYSHPWLFVNTAGQPVRYHSFRANVWDPAVAKTMLNPKPTPHALRHTCASWMIQRGVPLAVVSRHLGHENIQITVDTYSDVDRSSFAAAAAAIDEALD